MHLQLAFHGLLFPTILAQKMHNPSQVPKSYKEDHTQHHVEILTAKNFQEKVIHSDSLWIVEFVTDNCFHCPQNIPLMRHVAKFFQGENVKKDCQLRVKFGAVNSRKLQAEYDVVDFPTMMVFDLDKSNPAKASTSSELKKHGSLANFVHELKLNMIFEREEQAKKRAGEKEEISKSEREMADKIEEVKGKMDANLDADKKATLQQVVKNEKFDTSL